MTRQFYFQLVWLVFVCPNTQKNLWPIRLHTATCTFSLHHRDSQCADWKTKATSEELGFHLLSVLRLSGLQLQRAEVATLLRKVEHGQTWAILQTRLTDTCSLAVSWTSFFFLRIAKKKIQECVSLFLFLKYLFTFCFICDRMFPIQGSRLRERACIH